ncbi:DUF4362 domain-containing protein [Bacillus toyonensis]|uniref:DUF4362 domain-containing protein n=1 Tax=Bacillus toyonensis TaxID=155322 RepID=UPI000BF21E35|nr:DUF4362 domain-containing protein [Bacillus toyonensis]PEK11250.1 hypothetical protein CN681_09040 [Bacillus toyonensis]PEL54567.1 hypothetical protein CN638_02595 [Bacillus toyonensis]PGA03069.1 hypothetical protein COL67_26240 [Bacillus toyonensis]PGA57430.1 hypothetical protein COL86_06755 [Bacillus toyonensis]PGB62467.1 hypothetical protein COM00_12895 [Bacillus toyonensis]
MKIHYRKYALSVISLTLFALIGCANNEKKNNTNETYTFEASKKRGDIIENNDKIYNIEKLDAFVKNYNSNKDDSVRITKFNNKNEPVIIDLTVKKENEFTSLYYDVDYTKTNEKHNENQEIQYSNNTCQKIKKDIEDNKVTYKLECPDTIHLITAPK